MLYSIIIYNNISYNISFTRIFLCWNMKTFILIDLRISERINISFNHYYETFAVEICFHSCTLNMPTL